MDDVAAAIWAAEEAWRSRAQSAAKRRRPRPKPVKRQPLGPQHTPLSWGHADARAALLEHLPTLGSPHAEGIRRRVLASVLALAIEPPPKSTPRGHRPEELEWGAACRTAACLAVGRILRQQVSAAAWLAVEPHVKLVVEAWRWAARCRPAQLPDAVLRLLS